MLLIIQVLLRLHSIRFCPCLLLLFSKSVSLKGAGEQRTLIKIEHYHSAPDNWIARIFRGFSVKISVIFNMSELVYATVFRATNLVIFF